MKLVNVYIYSTAKSPKAAKSQCEAVGYILEYPTTKEAVTLEKSEIIENMTCYQSELYVLKSALSRINTMCELHIYTECEYIAAGFEKWLTEWKLNNWQTKRGEAVKNSKEWQELDQIVQQFGHILVFHVKENHSYKKWFKENLEKEKSKCLKSLESSTQQKK